MQLPQNPPNPQTQIPGTDSNGRPPPELPARWHPVSLCFLAHILIPPDSRTVRTVCTVRGSWELHGAFSSPYPLGGSTGCFYLRFHVLALRWTLCLSTPKNPIFQNEVGSTHSFMRWSADLSGKRVYSVFSAFSARSGTLGKQRENRATQTNGRRNKGKMASERRKFGTSKGARQRRGWSPSAAARPTKISIWTCTARYWEIWFSWCERLWGCRDPILILFKSYSNLILILL